MASQSIDMQCWKCGNELKNVLLPFSRREECSACNADLHVCLACKNYDSNISDACHEDRADFVLDKDKANFCDYFNANPKPHIKQDSSASLDAKAKLAELFGEDPPQELQQEGDSPQSEADKALAELKRMFGDDQKSPNDS